MHYETDASWVPRAACLGMGPDLFFPDQGADTATPKSVCRKCPVRRECLEHAVVHPEQFGIWGGLSDRERRRIRRYRSQEVVMDRNHATVAS